MLGRFFASQLIAFLRNLPSAAQEDYQIANTGFVRKVIAYNQTQILNYWHEVNETHKKLKVEFNRLNQLGRSPSQSDIASLKNLCYQLTETMRAKFRHINNRNFEYMHEIYARQNFCQKKPRFCVKTTYQNRNDYSILTFGRDGDFVYEKEYKASKSSAFSKVITQGKYYICNNIPRAIINGEYQNSRIRVEAVKDYYNLPSFIENLRYQHTRAIDQRWRLNWIERNSSNYVVQDSLPRDYYYKSTLIIPISLDTSDLSEEFLKDFGNPPGKITLGFLCSDHENINFFNEKDHVNAGYFFAGLMSLYLYIFLKCTAYSKIYKRANQVINTTK